MKYHVQQTVSCSFNALHQLCGIQFDR